MIPTSGAGLARYIKQLQAEGRLYAFYKSREWLTLRNNILMENHNECRECLKRGAYTQAVTVHHVNEVKHRPDLALSRKYIDIYGVEHDNLIPLCQNCHNEAHKRKFGGKPPLPQINAERWE